MIKMADNENISINNTATESLLLSEPEANSTPIMNNKVSLEDLFQLMKIQNNELREQSIKFDTKLDNFNHKINQFDEQFNDIKKEIKNQSCNSDKRLNEIHERLDKIELSLIHI